MATNHVQKGDVIDYTNGGSAAISSGDAVIIGTLVGVALVDIAVGDAGAVAVTEVWTLPKNASEAITQGAKVYLNSSGDITATSTDNTFAGVAFAAAAGADAGVDVLLNAGAAEVAAA
jgi:predicted RecA/RadA family phage recombinase